MTILIQDHVVWLQIPVYDVSLVQIIQRKQYLSRVQSRPVLRELPFSLQDLAQVAAVTEVQDQEQFGLGLEGVVEVHDERVFGIRQHVAFSLGVSYQILTHDLLFAQHFHGVQFARLLLLDQVHLAETATAYHLDGHEVVRTHLLVVCILRRHRCECLWLLCACGHFRRMSLFLEQLRLGFAAVGLGLLGGVSSLL